MAAQLSFFITPQMSDAGPQTLADLMLLIESSMSGEIGRGSVAAKRYLTDARTITRYIERLCKLPAQSIRLNDLVEIDAELIAFVEGEGINRESAVQYSCNKNKLLEKAHASGWTCESFELRQDWKPFRSVLKGHARGTFGIINDAVRDAIRPCEFTEQHVLAWTQAQLASGRSLLTVTADECHFRTQLRRAGLQKMLPGFDLGSKAPPTYAATPNELDPGLLCQIESVITWKTAECVPGRDAKLAIRPPSATNLRKALLQLCGYAMKKHKPRLTNPTSLIEILDPEIVCPYIQWLKGVCKCKKTTITTRLSGIHSLACSHPLFAGRDYSQIRTELNRIEREPKHLLEERKKLKYVRYDLFASIPIQIQNERLGDKPLTPVERAWLVHDELFMTWPLYLPWRKRNWRELAISGPLPVSLLYDEIPADLKHQLELPGWARRRRKLWQFTFGAGGTKGNRAVWNIVPRELLALLTIYHKTYRPELVRAGKGVGVKDPGTLFLNRNFEAMSDKDVSALVTRLTVRYTGTRVTPHIVRDIFAANYLEEGGKIEDLRKILWQADISTTQKYCKRFDASSHAAICIDEYFTRIDSAA